MSDTSTPPALMTRPECARFLRISVSALDKLIHDRDKPLPKFRAGRRMLFDPGAILKHLREVETAGR